MSIEETISATWAFLGFLPEEYYFFPSGGDLAIPLTSEEEFLQALEKGQAELAEVVPAVRMRLSRKQAYALAIFAVRMAILGAKTKGAGVIRHSLISLMFDDDLVDSRDILCALSLVEDCGSRVAMDTGNLLETLVEIATWKRRETIVDGYLARPPNMRTIDVFGYFAVINKEGLRYTRHM